MDRASIERLCRPGAFDHSVENLVLRETHISWIILCGPFAYKLKKPVNFGFLDFSTLAQRKHFCDEELRLNRRFSPELYLAVVPVTGTPGEPVMNRSGAAIDYAVKMHRFDEGQLLDNVAARGELDSALVRSIGREMARLHTELPRCSPDPDGREPGTPAALQAAMLQNFQQVRAYPLQPAERQQLSAVENWSGARLDALLPAMHRRIREGWVIDGHGDSHLGNMVIVEGRLRLFDCIEFNAAFRIVDSIAEIALLDMDLNARGHPAESHRLLSDYLEYRGDFDGLALLDLYRSYYALVRAKVNLLRHPAGRPGLADSEDYAEMRRYLGLAYRYCRPRRRFLVITHGLSGSGKSTVAGKLVEASGAIRIRSDVERKRLAGLAPEQRSHPEDTQAMYSTAMSVRTFDRLADLASTILNAGFAVIVDGTFLHRHVRDDFRQLAERLAVPFAIVDCIADPEELRRRLLLRQQGETDASEADIAVMEMQSVQREELSNDERKVTLSVDSGSEPSRLWEALEKFLRSA
ncbi:AAA family ATPase [Haliea sp. E17]|uniref:bifunctional aminoglycoside phosphotransferase/ATP-binding protein n=1 Tax=Haliea sp. E17 TaxID=3401576 RepID=UPI003AACB179